MRNAAPAMLVVLSLLAAAPARPAPQPGRTTLRAWMGFSTLALGDINSRIEAQRTAFGSDTTVDELRWDPFGGAPNLGGELDVQISPKLSAGIGVDVLRSSVSHQVFRVFSLDPDTGEPAEFETTDEHGTVSAWDVVGNVSMWVPSAPGLYFGAQVGLMRGTFTHSDVYHVETFTAFPDLRFTDGTFKGTGAVLGAFTGYDQALTPQLSLTTRMGYRFRQISRPLGVTYVTDWGDQGNTREWENGQLVDQNGKPMNLDLGGFYFQVGLSATLGGN